MMQDDKDAIDRWLNLVKTLADGVNNLTPKEVEQELQEEDKPCSTPE